jgi:hypothetical protein
MQITQVGKIGLSCLRLLEARRGQFFSSLLGGVTPEQRLAMAA